MMRKILNMLVVALLLFSALLVSGCSNSASEEQLNQLNALKKEVADLEKEIGNKQRDKAALEKQIAEKNGKLQLCQADQEAVKKALGAK